MPNGAHPHRATMHASRDQPMPVVGDDPPSKRDLTSWWKNFKKNTSKKDEEKGAPIFNPTTTTSPGIFGVPLTQSIIYANVAISLYDADGHSFIYGYVPIVVAKCGIYLKEKATDIEGIFRLAGAERRIKELQEIFNSSPRYGKGLDWSGYTVHDAANILRRYFNQLPEPIVPLDFYTRFREPLRNHQASAVGKIDLQEPDVGSFAPDTAIRTFQRLITELPPLNRQLLLYVLDLLAVFASKSDVNRMNASNLAAIFQPGLLSHPDHALAPKEYRLSQDILIFLIENQDNFLIGMQGTSADEKTIKEVQSGAPSVQTSTPPSTNSKRASLVDRSASNASVGADSVRRYGNIRRNLSVSSKKSRQSANAASPVTPPPDSPFASNGKSIGVHRSNTLPSKKSQSPAMASSRFQQTRNAGTVTMATATVAANPSKLTKSIQGAGQTPSTSQTSKSATPQPERMSPHLRPVPAPSKREYSKDRQLRMDLPSPTGGRSPTGTPGRERAFSGIFSQSPTSDAENRQGRKPNKLQKRRPDVNLNPQTSNQSLSGSSHPSSPNHAAGGFSHSQGNLIDDIEPLTPTAEGYESAVEDLPPPAFSRPIPGGDGTQSVVYPQENTTPRASAPVSSANTLKPQSPGGSRTSQSTDEDNVDEGAVQERKERRSRWRLSASTKRDKDKAGATGAERSNSSIGTRPRKSFTDDSTQSNSHTGVSQSLSDNDAGSEREKRGGPMSWFKRKMQEGDGRKADKERAKSPPPAGKGAEAQSSLINLASAETMQPTLPTVGESVERPSEPLNGLETLPGESKVLGSRERWSTTEG